MDTQARFTVDAAVTFDEGKDGDGMLLAHIALEPWPVTPISDRDSSSGLLEGDYFFVTIGVEPTGDLSGAGYFLANLTTPSLRGDSGGVAIIADTTSGGPSYSPRPPDMKFDTDGLQVQNWGWRVRILVGGEATFLLPSPIAWYLDGEAMEEAAITVTLALRVET